jgi:hypothetical protein
MENNLYSGLKLLQEGTPLANAWKEYITYCMNRNMDLLARAETDTEIFRLQGQHKLYKEMMILPTSIKRNNENA